jgi:hypothetical protein
VRADLLPAREAGIPLVHVYSGVEACADYGESWASYTSPARSKPGMAHLALQQTGLQDPPSCSTFRVKFDGKRKLAVVTREEDACREDGGKPKVEETRWVLVDGVYRVERAGGVVR